uniref:Integrator complex subunit 7 n=1 Tax=Aegilops tauschii subsp. strangulata TaxID=200361 RepID=A0A453DZW2_AEGTS
RRPRQGQRARPLPRPLRPPLLQCCREVKAALFAAGCFCKLSEDFSYITLQVLAGLVISPTSEAQVIMAAIKTFSKLDCTLAVIRRVHEVGKQMVLGNLEDVFKAEILFALSRLASKSIVLFGDQVALLLSFLGHESLLPMRTMVLKSLCFMFRRNAFYLPSASTVFGTLLQLIDDEDFPLDCKRYAFRILQKILCVKDPSIRHISASELSKLALAAKRFLHCSSWEMQYDVLEILLDIFFCFLKQTKPHQTISTLESSPFSYIGYPGISNNMLSTHEETSEDERSLNKILTAIVDNIIYLANQLANCRSKEVATGHIYVSSCELEKYKALFSLLLKLVSGYPSAASAALDKVRCLMKELAQINASHHSGVAASCVESSVEPAAGSIKASCMETDTDMAKLASTEFCNKKKSSVVHDLILCTLKFANACHDMCHKTFASSCDLHHSVKGLTECVQQNASQYCSTYEFFRLIMCAHISWSTCKIRDGNKGSGDSNEHPKIFFTPAWIAHELCALRMAKMLTRKQSYWEAYRSAMYCCHEGLWFTASFVFRKVSAGFESGTFGFWFKSLLLFAAGELEMKLLLFPSAISKLVGELNTEIDLHEDLYCVETDVDSTLAGSIELHGCQEKITGICERTCLANDVLTSNASSDREFFFQRWFISLRASFLKILTDVLGILNAHSSAPKDISHHESSSVAIGNNQVLLALTNCSSRLSDLAKSYDLLAASHGDMDHESFTTIARLAFMCSLLSFCTAFSVDFSNVPGSSEPCRLPERFSYASVLQDLHQRVDRNDSQVFSQLRQFMSVSSFELDSVHFSTRMNMSGNLEKDSYSLFKFAVASLLRARADAKGVTTGEDALHHLHRGMQLLSSILRRFMELPFVLPRHFFSVRPCLGAELFMFDSNPANKDRISVPRGFQLSLTLCLKWKRVLERTPIRIAKLYCILATSPSSPLHIAGTRSKQFEMRRTTSEMAVLHSKLLQHIKSDLRKTSHKENSHTELVAAFACFKPAGSGQGFSDCLLDVSSFPRGEYQIAWQACCVDENGRCFSLLPLNDGAVFSVQ